MLFNHSFAPYSILKDRSTFIPPSRTLLDLDGNEYTIVAIGSQELIVENFRCTKYSDNSPIPLITDGTDWMNDITGAYCAYDNDNDNIADYGLLYNWYTLINTEVSDIWDENSGYESFDTIILSGLDITSAINTSAHDGVAATKTFAVTAGTQYTITLDLTLNSGTAPSLGLIDTEDNYNLGVLSNGINTFTYTPVAGVDTLEINIGVDLAETNFSATLSMTKTSGSIAYLENNGVQELGWRIMTDADRIAIRTALGGTNALAGAAMKEAGFTHWDSPNTGATNSSGFTGVGSGYRDHNGNFYGLKDAMMINTTLEADATNQWAMILVNTTSNLGSTLTPKKYGCSIRLVRDIVEGEILTDDNGLFLTDDNFNLINLE